MKTEQLPTAGRRVSRRSLLQATAFGTAGVAVDCDDLVARLELAVGGVARLDPIDLVR